MADLVDFLGNAPFISFFLPPLPATYVSFTRSKPVGSFSAATFHVISEIRHMTNVSAAAYRYTHSCGWRSDVMYTCEERERAISQIVGR